MKMYRIISTIKSPFVFLKEDAEFRCEQANKHFRGIKRHTIRLSENYKKEEIRYMYPDDISIDELKRVLKELNEKN